MVGYCTNIIYCLLHVCPNAFVSMFAVLSWLAHMKIISSYLKYKTTVTPKKPILIVQLKRIIKKN
jgi:hypothetical protein